jgi:hypothetical protein
MIQKKTMLAGFVLSLACFASGATIDPDPGVSDSAPKRLVLHDFDRPSLVNNVGGPSAAWANDPNSALAWAELAPLSTLVDDGHSNALYLSYAFNKQGNAAVGFRTKLRGLDATAYDHLEFRIKGDPRKGFARSIKVQFLRPSDETQGQVEGGSYVVKDIRAEWQQVRVPLSIMNGIKDWSGLQDFVVVLKRRQADDLEGAYYIDDIALVKTGEQGPSVGDAVIPLKKKAWEAALGGERAAAPYIRARLRALPSRRLVDRDRFPQDTREFLWCIARDTWRGLEAMVDKENGLPVDNIRLDEDGQGPGAVRVAYLDTSLNGAQPPLADTVRVGDYTNVTNIGMYMMSVVAATDLGFIPREEAIARLRRTLATLEQLETYQGFFYNYYDTTTLERTSNFISFVDSAWLTAGLMVVRRALPELHGPATHLIEQTDYRWLYDDVEQLMSHGYYVNLKYPSEYHYGLLYTESRAGSLIAIGKGDVPEEHWWSMVRTFPPEYEWQTQVPRDREMTLVNGNTPVVEGYYQWGEHKYVPSWGGSMFEALMPTLVVDELKYAPASLGVNNKAHTDIQRRYALEVLKYPVWGMSPSSTVPGGGYSEYGVKVLGSKGYKSGVITPHASALALEVSPDEVVANLRRLVELYDIYGEYGFYDAVDPVTGKVTYKYLTLDQAMLFIALANYLDDHSVQEYFASDPIAAKALAIIGEERFFE